MSITPRQNRNEKVEFIKRICTSADMGCKRKSQLLSASEPENKRDGYQYRFHVETMIPDETTR